MKLPASMFSTLARRTRRARAPAVAARIDETRGTLARARDGKADSALRAMDENIAGLGEPARASAA
jgi:hypothetical protein